MSPRPAMLMLMFLPLLGAVVSALLWSQPRAVRWIAGLVTACTLAGLLISLDDQRSVPSLFMVLFAATGLAIVLGQQRLPRAPFVHVMMLLILGLSLGSLTMGWPMGHLLLGGLMGSVALAGWMVGRVGDPLRVGSAVCFALGGLSLLGSLAVGDPASSLLKLIAYVTLLPLFPFHVAFVGSLTALPGALPAFLVIVLPCLGWHGMTTIVHSLPAAVSPTLLVLALTGAVLGLMRASVQVHLGRVLASSTVALLALAWWHLGLTTAIPAAWYVATVTVATSGLLLGAHLLEARYGVLDLEKLGGLARTMPRFTVVIGLLVMAGMGLPFLGVFSAFMSMAFTASTLQPGRIFVVLIWFAASLLLLKLWHRVFYGRLRTDFLYRDLTGAELAPFVLLLGLLVLGGAISGRLFPVAEQTAAGGSRTSVTMVERGR